MTASNRAMLTVTDGLHSGADQTLDFALGRTAALEQQRLLDVLEALAAQACSALEEALRAFEPGGGVLGEDCSDPFFPRLRKDALLPDLRSCVERRRVWVRELALPRCAAAVVRRSR
jgi:hypothetical protein